jgi:hypothetical protein
VRRDAPAWWAPARFASVDELAAFGAHAPLGSRGAELALVLAA